MVLGTRDKKTGRSECLRSKPALCRSQIFSTETNGSSILHIYCRPHSRCYFWGLLEFRDALCEQNWSSKSALICTSPFERNLQWNWTIDRSNHCGEISGSIWYQQSISLLRQDKLCAGLSDGYLVQSSKENQFDRRLAGGNEEDELGMSKNQYTTLSTLKTENMAIKEHQIIAIIWDRKTISAKALFLSRHFKAYKTIVPTYLRAMFDILLFEIHLLADE